MCYLKCLLQKHPSLPPCVKSSPCECVSIQVSPGDSVKIIKCYGMASFLEFSLLLLLKARTRSSPGGSSPLRSFGVSSGCHFHRHNIQCSPHTTLLPKPSHLELPQNTGVAWRWLPYKGNANDYCSCQACKESEVQYLLQGPWTLFFLLHCHVDWSSLWPWFCGNVLTLDFRGKVFHQHTRVWYINIPAIFSLCL